MRTKDPIMLAVMLPIMLAVMLAENITYFKAHNFLESQFCTV
jgi:hypothetical protein